MPRRSYQRGSLSLIDSNWSGRYLDRIENLDGSIKTINRRVFLGTSKELPTKADARRKLDRVLDSVNSRHEIILKNVETKELAPPDKGAIGELVVAVDLLQKQFAVYQNFSSIGGVDLVAIKDRRCYRVQVKRRYQNCNLTIPAYMNLLTLECDILAFVNYQGKILYYTKLNLPELKPEAVPELRQLQAETSENAA